MTDTVYMMTTDEWEEEFKPCLNFTPGNAADGIFIEICEEERNFLCEHDPLHIWTAVGQDGVVFIVEELHIINRLGYFITEKPYLENTSYVITDAKGISFRPLRSKGKSSEEPRVYIIRIEK